jgi:hypothetical protein
MIGVGALVAGVPDDRGIDIGDHLAIGREVLLQRAKAGLDLSFVSI